MGLYYFEPIMVYETMVNDVEKIMLAQYLSRHCVNLNLKHQDGWNYGGGGKRQDAARNAAPRSHTDLSFDLGAALTSEDIMKVFVGVDKDDNRYCGKDMAAVLRNIEDACGGQLVWQEWRDKGSYHVINWRSNIDQEIVIYVTEEEI